MGESARLVEQCLANIVNWQPEWRHESIGGVARFKRVNDRVAGTDLPFGPARRRARPGRRHQPI